MRRQFKELANNYLVERTTVQVTFIGCIYVNDEPVFEIELYSIPVKGDTFTFDFGLGKVLFSCSRIVLSGPRSSDTNFYYKLHCVKLN